MTHWLLLVVATAVTFAGAVAVTSALGLPDALDRVLATAVIFGVEITVSMLIAGAGFSALRPGVVLALVGGLAILAVAVRFRDNRSVSAQRLTRGAMQGLIGAARAHPFAATLLALATLEVAWRVFVAVVVPPYGTDAIWYHLTAVAGWVQSGSLERSRLSLESATYPLGGELLLAWSVLFLHSDALVDLTQLPFACVGGLAVAGIVRTIGLDRPSQVVAGSLFVLTPVVLAQSSTAYVDLMFASAFLVGMHFVLRFLAASRDPLPTAGAPPPEVEVQSTRLVVLAGLAMGLALGMKTTAPVAIAVILLLIVGDLARTHRGRFPFRRAVVAAGSFTAAAVAVGSFWYIRDWVDVGNPVYPFRVPGLFAGPITSGALERSSQPATIVGEPLWLQVIRSWGHDILRLRSLAPYSYDDRLGGLGLQWPVMLGLLLLTVIWCYRRRSGLLLEFIAAVMLVWLLEPYHWWSRFSIYLAALGATAVAVWTSKAIAPVWRRTVACVTLAAVVSSLYLVTAELPLGYGRQLSFSQVIGLAEKPRADVTIGRTVCSSFAWVDQIPRGARIGIDPRYPTFIYALFGRDLEHQVVPIWGDTRAAFLQEVRRVDYVFLPVRDVDQEWAAGQPQVLHLTYSDPAVRVYALHPAAGGVSRSDSLAGCPSLTARPRAVNEALRRIDQ